MTPSSCGVELARPRVGSGGGTCKTRQGLEEEELCFRGVRPTAVSQNHTGLHSKAPEAQLCVGRGLTGDASVLGVPELRGHSAEPIFPHPVTWRVARALGKERTPWSLANLQLWACPGELLVRHLEALP